MKKVLSVLLAVMLLCSLALPAAADGDSEAAGFNKLATDVSDSDLDVWASMIADAVESYLGTCDIKLLNRDDFLSAVRGSVYQTGDADYPGGYLAGIRNAESRSDLISLFSHMERNAAMNALYAATGEQAIAHEFGQEFEATAGTLLTQNLYCDYYARHVQLTNTQLTEEVLAYYNAHADAIIAELNEKIPDSLAQIKSFLSKDMISYMLQTYLNDNAGDINDMVNSLATSFETPEKKVEMIQTGLNVTLTGLVNQMLVWMGKTVDDYEGLAGAIADFAAGYAKTVAAQYGTWLASVLGEGSLAIITGIAGLAIGAVGTLLITKKKKPAEAGAEE